MKTRLAVFLFLLGVLRPVVSPSPSSPDERLPNDKVLSDITVSPATDLSKPIAEPLYNPMDFNLITFSQPLGGGPASGSSQMVVNPQIRGQPQHVNCVPVFLIDEEGDKSGNSEFNPAATSTSVSPATAPSSADALAISNPANQQPAFSGVFADLVAAGPGSTETPTDPSKATPDSKEPAKNGDEKKKKMKLVLVPQPAQPIFYHFAHSPLEVMNPFNYYSLPRSIGTYNGLMPPFKLTNPTNYVYGDSPYAPQGFYPQVPNLWADPFSTGIQGGYNYGLNNYLGGSGYFPGGGPSPYFSPLVSGVGEFGFSNSGYARKLTAVGAKKRKARV